MQRVYQIEEGNDIYIYYSAQRRWQHCIRAFGRREVVVVVKNQILKRLCCCTLLWRIGMMQAGTQVS